MVVTASMASISASMTPTWALPRSCDCMPVKIRSNCLSRAKAAIIEAIWKGSRMYDSSSAMCTARSQPMARAFFMVSLTRSGPMESTVRSASPTCSFSRTACSTANSSYSFIRQARSARSYQLPSPLILNFDSMSGTCLMHTRIFMAFPPAIRPLVRCWSVLVREAAAPGARRAPRRCPGAAGGLPRRPP